MMYIANYLKIKNKKNVGEAGTFQDLTEVSELRHDVERERERQGPKSKMENKQKSLLYSVKIAQAEGVGAIDFSKAFPIIFTCETAIHLGGEGPLKFGNFRHNDISIPIIIFLKMKV